MKLNTHILRRVPLTPKLLLLTIFLGVVVWGLLDYAQSKRLRALIESSMTAQLSRQGQENRIRFDNYLGVFPQIAKLIVSSGNFAEFGNRTAAVKPEGKGARSLSELPPWLPDAAVMRKLAHVDYALLLDPQGRPREIYSGRPGATPPMLLQPPDLLLQLSRGQAFLTSLGGESFLVTTASPPSGVSSAMLMLATRLDHDFLIASQGTAVKDTLIVLAEGDPAHVIASTQPALVPAGASLDALRREYLVTSKSFFDWGGSDLIVQFVSLISNAEFERLNASVIAAERLQRAVLSLALILAFGAVMFWISRHIKNLSRGLMHFSQNELGIRHQTIQRGDELFLIESQFGNLTEEIINSREALKKEAEEKIVLTKKAMEAERQEQELKLLQALKVSEENYRSIFDSANDAIFVHDINTGAILDTNRKMTELYGYTPEEAKSVDIGALSSGEPPYDLANALQMINKAVAGDPQLFEWLARDKFGRLFWVEVNLKWVVIGGKDRLLAIVRDVSSRKKAEEELRRYSAKLESSNKELELFASIASHDLQEPLRVVSGFAQLLDDRYKGKLDKDADEFIGYIVDGAFRMHYLINDLLEYSRVTTRGNPFRAVDCGEILRKALANLKTAMDESGAVISVDPLPAVTADESQFVRLFQNLIANAVKYRKKDEPPRVHISAIRLDDPSVFRNPRPEPESKAPHSAFCKGWLFSVKDNGIGIDAKYFERIFQIFQRLHSRREYPGTGIGLAVCKKIVERHGGAIWVESEPGQGSVFHFTLPEQAGENDCTARGEKEAA